MRYAVLIWIALLIVGCAVRVPTMRPPVTRTFNQSERQQLLGLLADLLTAEQIGVTTRDVGAGVIVTDSFDVLPEYCDCGKNMLGAEYPGQRHGQIRVKINSGRVVTVTMDIKTRLRITTNDREVICTSTGVLENRLFAALEKKLGKTSVH